MKDERIKSGNLLIAEFDKKEKDGYWYKTPEDLCYHNEWNWLMPIVDKLEKFNNEWIEDIEFIRKKNAIISRAFLLDGLGSRINGPIGNTNGSGILSWHSAVVAFIEWFNEQDKKVKRNRKNKKKH